MVKSALIMNKGNLSLIRDIIYKAVRQADFEVNIEDIHIEKTKNLEHGHFSTNIAMFLAGKIGKRSQDIAESIVEHLKGELIEKAEIAGPGFINLWLEQKFYTAECQLISGDLSDYIKKIIESESGKIMTIDYSSPNIAKPLGAHHLLSTIIGDSIKRIYRKLGWKVIADNYLGDMGTQFGKLIVAIRKWGDWNTIEVNPISELLKLYVRFHNEVEKDPVLDDEARAEFKKFEEGDEENRKIWKKIVDWSIDDVLPLYKRLDIDFDYMNGESFYEDKMQAVLDDGRKKNVFVDGDGGSWIVMPDDPNDPPAIVRKSDASTIYLTRDLAQTAYWENEFHPDLMVWVVDSAQSLHFRQRFHASRKLGQTTARMIHVNFGRMHGMSTRKGEMVPLNDLLDEAESRSIKLIQEKGANLSEDEKKLLTPILAIGSVKYIVLSQSRTKDIEFDWDKMLALEGNSAPYLMYTTARAKSVIRKSDNSINDINHFDLNLSNPLEYKLVTDLLMYPDTIRRAANEFKPNHIANYLYDLAQNFNSFYNALKINQAETEDFKKSRLLITSCVIRVMEDGLGLLGIEVPEKM